MARLHIVHPQSVKQYESLSEGAAANRYVALDAVAAAVIVERWLAAPQDAIDVMQLNTAQQDSAQQVTPGQETA
jgi:hypothetical protein